MRLPVSALLVVVAALVACAGWSGEQREDRLHVSGNVLVDAGGRQVRLLGVNRSGAEYACTHSRRPRLGFFAGPTDSRAIRAMAAWGVNVVRIPLNEHCWLGVNGLPVSYSAARYRAAIRAYVSRLERARLYVILDLHWSRAGTKPADGQEAMADLDHAPAFWASVARTFKAHDAVIFDLFNEPHSIGWQCWRDGCVLPGGWRAAGMQRLVDAVRSSGARQPIIAAGLNWGGDLSGWRTYRPQDPANQLMAGLHVFDFASCNSPGCWTQDVAAVAGEVPVVATELGQRWCGAAFIDGFMGWADAAGVSYLGWSWNPSGCAAPALIRSWHGRPTATGHRLRTNLLRLHAARVPRVGR